ncbi:MAG: hypothetical protein Q8M92_07790 [Candidatus Subteraquimicrobiales bacterium]|nr:hypothetical protein [Candidatus Subteraquimicrobiales bacterium]
MNGMERAKLQDEISATFRDGKILTASEEELQKYLMSLCSEHVPNDMVRHRETIRALTINHIQMQRHIDKLNKQNTVLQIIIIVLTVIVIITATVQTYTTIKYSKEIFPHTMQQAPLIKPVSNPNSHNEATKGDLSISSQPPN